MKKQFKRLLLPYPKFTKKNKLSFYFFLFSPFVLLYFIFSLANFDNIFFVYLKNFIGSIYLLFIPGYYISFILFPFQILKIERFVISLTFSILIPSFAIFFLNNHFPEACPLNFLFLIKFYFYLQLFCISSILIIFLFKKDKNIEPSIGSAKEFIWPLISILPLLILLIIISIQNPYIRNVDDSYYFSLSKSIISTSQYPEFRPQVFPPFRETNPPIFPIFMANWGIMSDIGLNQIYKILFTMLSLSLFFPFYLIVKKINNSEKIAFLASLALASVPVLFVQILKSRPQTLVFFIFIVFLYFLINYLKLNDWKKDSWIFSAILILILGVGLHIMVILFFPLLLITLLLKHFFWIKNNLLKSFLILAFILLAIYPYLVDLGIINKIFYLLAQIKQSYTSFNLFNNPFGIITYGANYAFLLFPLFFVSVFLLIKKKTSLKLEIILLICYCATFIFFQEVLPRFGFNFLSDRSFPHLAIGLVILGSLSIDYVLKNKKVYRIAFYFLLISSFIAVIFVSTFLPAYYTISDKEIAAIKFLNQENDVLAITQVANIPAILEFGNFMYVSRSDVLVNNLFNSNIAYEAYIVADEIRNYKKSITNSIQLSKDKIISNINNFKGVKSDLILEEINKLKKLQNIRANINIDDFNLYILYSKVKSKSFYNRKVWWKQRNYINVDLDKFDDTNYFKKVFENDDIIVWKVKKLN